MQGSFSHQPGGMERAATKIYIKLAIEMLWEVWLGFWFLVFFLNYLLRLERVIGKREASDTIQEPAWSWFSFIIWLALRI